MSDGEKMTWQLVEEMQNCELQSQPDNTVDLHQKCGSSTPPVIGAASALTSRVQDACSVDNSALRKSETCTPGQSALIATPTNSCALNVQQKVTKPVIAENFSSDSTPRYSTDSRSSSQLPSKMARSCDPTPPESFQLTKEDGYTLITGTQTEQEFKRQKLDESPQRWSEALDIALAQRRVACPSADQTSENYVDPRPTPEECPYEITATLNQGLGVGV